MSNYFSIPTGTQPLTFGTATNRYRNNIAAIQLLNALPEQGLTPGNLDAAQLLTLAHYSAFGESVLMRRIIEEAGANGKQEGLLTEDELSTIRRAALTAFYTPVPILHALWGALAPTLRNFIANQLGADDNLRFLETSAGIGLFLATMPTDIRDRSKIVAVEKDIVSGKIAQFLSPDALIHSGTGFEDVDLPEDEFDLVASNIPFGAMKVFDPAMEKEGTFLTHTIHDYFIARSLKLCRPGGLVVDITSYGTMDKRDDRVRQWYAQRAELIKAVRLPQGSFSQDAGTACGADLLIFRRTPVKQFVIDPAWTGTETITVPVVEDSSRHFTHAARAFVAEGEEQNDEAGLRLSHYFVSSPDDVIGTIELVRDRNLMFSSISVPEGTDVAAALAERLVWLDTDLLQPRPERTARVAPVRRGRAALNTDNPRIAGMLGVYDAAKAVLQLDANGHDATNARNELNHAYDTFVRSCGILHSRVNVQALRGEPELLFLKALETDVRQNANGEWVAAKTAIFSRPTVRPTPEIVAGSMTPDEALLTCLDTVGRVDMDVIAKLAGDTSGDVAAALTGRIFRLPNTNEYVTADEYLSGNIREKLLVARTVAAEDPAFADHVTALTAVMPAPLTPGQIKVKLGAPWVPVSIVEQFICSIIPAFRTASGKVVYVQPLAKWNVATEWKLTGYDVDVQWGTPRVHALDIIEQMLNQRTPVVYDTDDDGKRHYNREATLAAREKAMKLREEWYKWVWADADRTDLLCKLYNETFNGSKRRDFDGSHLRLNGLNTSVLRTGDLDAHQKDCVWMGLQKQSMLVHVPVGGGKTFIGLTLAHEWKRLGLAKKPLIVAPNHLTEQWAQEANRLYPSLRVLAMSAEDFTKHKRGTFLSRIATEEWDLIIIASSSFQFIEIGEAADTYIMQRVRELRYHLELLQAEVVGRPTRAQKRSHKEVERKIDALEVRLKGKTYGVQHDQRIITWEELGVDALILDEAHDFKNLGVDSRMGNIPGIPTGDSARAFDMRLKTWELRKRGGRVVFMTATPIMNTLGEAFIFQTYLQDDVLKEYRIDQFDAWAATFAETETIFEMTPDGGGFRMNTRLCRFVNLPELFNLWYLFTFSRSKDQLNIPVPTLVTGKPIPVAIPASKRLKAFVGSLVSRVEAIKSGNVEPWQDNMLNVVNDGRKAALDMRLVLGGPADPVNKIETCADHVGALYRRYDAEMATQLIYCEMGTPKTGTRKP